jgi:hypothetical protein
MECFRRAMLPDVPDNTALRWHGKAVALSRMNTEMIRSLEEHQAATTRAQPQPQPAAQPAVPAASPHSALAEAARRAAFVPAKRVGGKDPMSSERASPAPAGFPATAPTPTAPFLAAPPPRQSAHAALLGSTSQVGVMLAAAAA